jgi:hypothetical protein
VGVQVEAKLKAPQAAMLEAFCFVGSETELEDRRLRAESNRPALRAVDLIRLFGKALQGSLATWRRSCGMMADLDVTLGRMFDCWRRSKSEPPCQSNIEPGLVADQRVVSCG